MSGKEGVIITMSAEGLYLYQKAKERGYGGSLSEFISDLIIKVWGIKNE